MSIETLSAPDPAQLHLRIDDAIRQHPHLRTSQIEPQTEGDNVVLKGTVDSFFLKQMAQEAVRGVEGTGTVDNQLEVAW